MIQIVKLLKNIVVDLKTKRQILKIIVEIDHSAHF